MRRLRRTRAVVAGLSGRRGFRSGIEDVVDRAKTKAVKISIESAEPAAIGVNLLAKAVQEEFEETRDAVLDADPVQWSRINGFEAGHVTRIRPTAQ